MTEQELELVRYPLGRMPLKTEFTQEEISQNIKTLEDITKRLREATTGMSDEQLNTPYREGGWNTQIVIHHIADSHMNGYGRFKMALTENKPLIKPYDEAEWAKLADYNSTPHEVSLRLIESLHVRWCALAESMTNEQFERTYIHPEHKLEFSLKSALNQYAWHSEHHLAHITNLKKKMNW